ncbi:MAG: hypothetical protein HY735_01715 [Verrucomicrobia bacterium]|nr:hypothetical protein [Verrucomicrobiota bacterium]
MDRTLIGTKKILNAVTVMAALICLLVACATTSTPQPSERVSAFQVPFG